MDPTCGLAEKFRDIVLDLIWEQLHDLVCYGQNISQLHEQLEELTLERSSIQHRIDEATNIADQEIDEKVVRWMGKVDEISEQVQKLHQESQGKRECSITSCPNLWLRYKLSKRAKAMAQQVGDICVEGNFDRVSYRVPPESMPQLTNRERNEGIDSRVPIMNQIMEALQDPNVSMIGLCGLGGVGKTTIAKDVAVANNQNLFEKVIMVTVSQEWNIEKIQRQIVEKLGIQINETTKDVIASRLCKRLKQEKSMLLILDDLWGELDLGEVGIPFIDGFKILLTSRDETLLSNRMNCQKIIKVGVLSEDEALELFKKIAELPIVSSSSDLMSIATEIVQKCGGLPLAIATAAKALRRKHLNEWKDYRARLNNPLRRNVTGIKELDAILKVSVDLLSLENRNIFLLTGMLSHDPSIEELLLYAVGLDILEGINNMKEARAGIFAIVNKLKSLNLFLDSFSSDRVTIHDAIRDVALSIASNELRAFVCRRLKEWPDENTLKGCKVICSQESDIIGLPEELHGPSLEFFLLGSTERDLTIPSMFFKSSKELKVLKLTNVKFPSVRSLSFLQKLKVLWLHSCLLQDIIEVGSLKKLKVLSLAHSEIQRLPIELVELTFLQMLNLSHCSKLRVIPPKILCSLKKLEILSMINSFSQWKIEGSSEANDNASLDELKGLPIYSLDIHIPNVSMLSDDLLLDMNLERYKIFIGEQEEWEWWQVNDETSKTLKLEIESNIHLKRGVQKLLEGVEDLCLCGSNASNEVFKSLFNSKDEQLSVNSFSNLKILTVVRCDFVKLLPLHVLKSLNNLEELEVRECEKLEMVFDFEDLNDYKGMESLSVVVPLKMLVLRDLLKLKNVWSNDPQGIVTKDEVSESVDAAFEFPRLTSFTLYKLPNLRNFYPKRHTLKWPHLQQLSIQYCDELEIFEKKVSSSSEIYEEESALNSKYPLLSYKVIHHNLKQLRLDGKQVEMIGSGQFPIYYFPKVKLLYLSVDKTVTISYASLLKSFPNLETLQLCGDFEETFGGDDVVALAPRLSTFTLKYISNMISLAPSLLSSPNLTHLEVSYCHRLTILMTSLVARCLVHLTHLSISYCHRMEEIIKKQEGEDDDEDKEIIFSKLKSLELDELSRLKRFCGHNYTLKFPVLDELTIEGCPKFKTFSPGTIDTPSLKSVRLSKSWREHREIWDTNLNKTVYQQRFVASRELVLDEDDTILIRNIDQFPSGPRSQVETLRIKRIVDEGLTIPYELLERFPQLKELEVERCSIKEIFPSHVPPSSASFHNLTKLKVSKCHQLVYLVTNSTAKCLANLEILEIDDCQNMEEIVKEVPNEDVEGGIAFNGLRILTLADLPRLKIEDEDKRDLNIEDMATNGKCSLFGHNTVIHHNLEELTLKGKQAKMIGSSQFQMYHFPKVKLLHLSVKETTTISYASLLRSFLNLESLQLEGDFEETFGVDDVATLAPRLSTFTLESTSNMISLAPSLLSSPNLTHLEVSICYRLTILMTSLVARCLVHLAHLSISSCHQIEEIITKNGGKDDDDREIIFSKLKSLELDHLPRLKRFCGHNYTFKFPLLKSVIITECPRLTMFCQGAIHAPLLESIQMDKDNPSKNIWRTNLNDTIQHQFDFEEVTSTTRAMALNAENITVITDVFPEVSDLYVESFQGEGVTFPYSSLERFPKLSWLSVEHCSFEAIFPSHDQIVDLGGKAPPFKNLQIAHLNQLKCIWNDDSQLLPIHQNLAYLKVKSCCNLVKLVPSSASFQYLEGLSISGCHQLIHSVTISTAKSLVILRWLEIKHCKRMEEIVMNETNEDVQGAITVNKLRRIRLKNMPSLKMFSSQSHNFEFPKLEGIEITGCPEMKMFCQGVVKIPKLSEVKIEDHDMEWKDGGDLNKTIETLSSAKVLLAQMVTVGEERGRCLE